MHGPPYEVLARGALRYYQKPMEALPVSFAATFARDLAKAPRMMLGPLTIDPPLRTLSAGGRSRVLEPRVMRVLVALAEEPGRVLTRDDLIDLAWDGTIVGDNAINRALSHVRKALTALIEDEIKLETIARVGFRLVVSDDRPIEPTAAATPPEPSPALADSRMTRRAVIGAGGLAAAACGAWFFLGRGPHDDPRAVDLYRRGQLLQKTGEPGTMEQAMSFYQQAIEIDPDYADAWGALAIGYRHRMRGGTGTDRAAFAKLMTSAARRALELDPRQADAAAALAMREIPYGHWQRAESDLRDLVRRFPDYWYGLGQLGIVLREVGRVRESLPFVEHQVEVDRMLPIAWSYLAQARLMDGRYQEADLALDTAAKTWPANSSLWAMRWTVLTESSRFEQAAAFLDDRTHRPDFIADSIVADFKILARGPIGGSEARDAAATVIRKYNEDMTNIPQTAGLLAMLGRIDLAFSELARYFAAAPGMSEKGILPTSATLFMPSILALRDDPRHGALLKSTGLEDYWERTGSQPDFRRN